MAGGIRTLLALPTRDEDDFVAVADAVGRRAQETGMTPAAIPLIPDKISVATYERQPAAGPEPHHARAWFKVEGMSRELIYNVVPPVQALPGLILAERRGGSLLTQLMSQDTCRLVAEGKQQVSLVFDHAFVNSDWRISVGKLRANSQLRAVLIDITYLPFSATAPPPFIPPLLDDMVRHMHLHRIEGLVRLSESNADTYAQYGLSGVPGSTDEDIPYRHYVVDVLVFIAQIRGSGGAAPSVWRRGGAVRPLWGALLQMKGNLPFSIMPTQQVAAAWQPQGQQAPATGRVSSPRLQTQNVDMQFSQVASQRQHLDKELQDLSRRYDDKARECDDLHEKVSKMSEYCEQDKARLAKEKELLKDEHAAAMAEMQASYDRDRKQLSDLLAEARHQGRALTKDSKSQQILSAEKVASLMDEIKRLESLVCICMVQRNNAPLQADHSKSDASRAVNDMELKLDKQATYITECEKQLALKDEQVKKAKKEVARATGNLEKVAQELVSRHKDRDTEIMRRQQQYETDARRATDELASLVQEKKDLTRSELQLKEEILLLKVQWDKAQTTNAELMQDISTLTARLDAKGESENITAREINDALQQLDAMKQENNGLHTMNDRLNEQLRMAQEEVVRVSEQASRLRDEAAEIEDNIAHAQRERASAASKVLRMVEATAEETVRLVEEVDAFRMIVREAAIQHAPEEARDMEMELLREQAREAELQTKRNRALVQNGDEHAVLTLSTRLREDIVLAWEDLRVVKSDVKDEISRFNDINAQHIALKEAYVVDREHLATLTSNLNEANSAYAKVQKEKAAMQDSLKEHDNRMQEFVALAHERDDNQAKLLRENKALKEEVLDLRGAEQGSVTERVQWERRELGLREDIDRLTKLELDSRQQKAELEGLLLSLRDELSRVTAELDEARRRQDNTHTESSDAAARLHEAETSADVLKNRAADLQTRLDSMKAKEDAAESENRTLRDENFQLRHSVEDLRAKMREVESSAMHVSSSQDTLTQQLRNQRGVNDLLKQTRDEADMKVMQLEEEKRVLTATVQDLKKETQALWHSMREASAENDQYRDALQISRMSHPAISPTPSHRTVRHPSPSPGHPGHASHTAHTIPPGLTAHDNTHVDDALRSIEERVSRLFATMAQ